MNYYITKTKKYLTKRHYFCRDPRKDVQGITTIEKRVWRN